MIKVSICIPTYEQPDNLYKCLESISQQNFNDFEVIVTDDSQSCVLRDVIKKFQGQFTVKYIKNSATKGSPENWNESIKYAAGKYIKIMHHDDYFKSVDSLKVFVDLLDENPNAKVAFCSSSHVDDNNNYLSSHILSDKKMSLIKKDSKYLFFGNVLGAPSTMLYHRNLNMIFDNRMKWLVDIDFYIRILASNKFVYTKKELVCIGIGEDRVTNVCENNKRINIYETMIMFEKFNLTTLSNKYKYHFLKLFSKFNITTKEEINKCGYDKKNIGEINKLFKYVKLFSILRKLKNVVK